MVECLQAISYAAHDFAEARLPNGIEQADTQEADVLCVCGVDDERICAFVIDGKRLYLCVYITMNKSISRPKNSIVDAIGAVVRSLLRASTIVLVDNCVQRSTHTQAGTYEEQLSNESGCGWFANVRNFINVLIDMNCDEAFRSAMSTV